MRSKYITQGFVPATVISDLGIIYLDQANVSITKGDAVFDDGAGFATNVGTAFAATFRGIAHTSKDNSLGSDGDTKVAIVPYSADVKYWVKNESGTVAAQTDVGEIVDLESNDGIDVTDVTVIEYGFLIDEIDITANALAANAGGFVLGRFIKTPESS